ncbi:hypothetical protein Tco_0779180 [Tanacetum coccineum]
MDEECIYEAKIGGKEILKETVDAKGVWRTSYVVHEEKESAEKEVSTEDPLSTAQSKVSTDKPEDSTDKPDEGTDKPKVSTNKEEVSTDIPDVAEEEVKKLAEEEATKASLSNEYDFIQARLNADKILAEKLQEEEREMYTIEQRAKFLHDTIAAQRRFLAQQRSEAIRNKPPLRNQLRNQMMTYLKHVGGKI